MTNLDSSQSGSTDAKEISSGYEDKFSLREWLYMEAGCADIQPQRFSEFS